MIKRASYLIKELMLIKEQNLTDPKVNICGEE